MRSFSEDGMCLRKKLGNAGERIMHGKANFAKTFWWTRNFEKNVKPGIWAKNRSHKNHPPTRSRTAMIDIVEFVRYLPACPPLAKTVPHGRREGAERGARHLFFLLACLLCRLLSYQFFKSRAPSPLWYAGKTPIFHGHGPKFFLISTLTPEKIAIFWNFWHFQKDLKVTFADREGIDKKNKRETLILTGILAFIVLRVNRMLNIDFLGYFRAFS